MRPAAIDALFLNMDMLFKKRDIHIAVTGRNLDELFPMLREFPVTIVEERPDLVISYGGDGALLGAERMFPGVPKCPVRDRKENPKCPRHSELSTLKKLFNGELEKVSLVKLEAVTEANERISGINEILLDRVHAISAIRYRIRQDGRILRPQVVADSLLVSTPFGSTGYFQSITHGNFQVGLGMAFNNSMDLISHTVVEENAVITVQLLRGPAIMYADNDPRHIPLETGSTVTIKALPQKTVLYGLDIFRCMDCYDLRKYGREKTTESR